MFATWYRLGGESGPAIDVDFDARHHQLRTKHANYRDDPNCDQFCAVSNFPEPLSRSAHSCSSKRAPHEGVRQRASRAALAMLGALLPPGRAAPDLIEHAQQNDRKKNRAARSNLIVSFFEVFGRNGGRQAGDDGMAANVSATLLHYLASYFLFCLQSILLAPAARCFPQGPEAGAAFEGSTIVATV